MGKNTVQKPEEKKPEPQQDTTMRIPLDLKAQLEDLKGPQESVADVVRRLMITHEVRDTHNEGMVTLRMQETHYRRLLVMQPSSVMSDILQKARV